MTEANTDDTTVVAEMRCLHARSYEIYDMKEEFQQVAIK